MILLVRGLILAIVFCLLKSSTGFRLSKTRQSINIYGFRSLQASTDASTDEATEISKDITESDGRVNFTPPESSGDEKRSVSKLTQKDYLISLRNRLFLIEEAIWLYEYARMQESPKVEPVSKEVYERLLTARGELFREYPLTLLMTDLNDAKLNGMSYAEEALKRMITDFSRKLPATLDHVNQIAVLSFSGQVMNLMRGQGTVYQRLMPVNTIRDLNIKRQFQHPSFSTSGRFVAFCELNFKTDGPSPGAVRSDALIYEVPKDPAQYGAVDLGPIFDSGRLPGAPFFIRFSPDEHDLVLLCTTQASGTYTAIVLIKWFKYYQKDAFGGVQGIARHAERKAVTLMQGNPVFFTYTTSNPKNATIIAHAQQEVVMKINKDGTQTALNTFRAGPQKLNQRYAETHVMGTEKAVWMLDREDTGGVRDFVWKKIAVSDETVKWYTPICHSAGGGDNVLMVEDGYLVSKAISRWKRVYNETDGTYSLPSKRLLPVKGQVQFLVSADHTKVAILEEDINIGHHKVTIIDGEEGLDPASPAEGRRFEIPTDRVTVAFWFSPDSTKLLCLTSRQTKEEIAMMKGNFKSGTGGAAGGFGADMQWLVYNFPLDEVKKYDTFKPTPYFMKTYAAFFSQYAQMYNPWAPDSRSFIYTTSTGLTHVPLVRDRQSLGLDRWTNQGATFGTWSRT